MTITNPTTRPAAATTKTAILILDYSMFSTIEYRTVDELKAEIEKTCAGYFMRFERVIFDDEDDLTAAGSHDFTIACTTDDADRIAIEFGSVEI